MPWLAPGLTDVVLLMISERPYAHATRLCRSAPRPGGCAPRGSLLKVGIPGVWSTLRQPAVLLTWVCHRRCHASKGH
jgi:hypothetical protein